MSPSTHRWVQARAVMGWWNDGILVFWVLSPDNTFLPLLFVTPASNVSGMASNTNLRLVYLEISNLQLTGKECWEILEVIICCTGNRTLCLAQVGWHSQSCGFNSHRSSGEPGNVGTLRVNFTVPCNPEGHDARNQRKRKNGLMLLFIQAFRNWYHRIIGTVPDSAISSTPPAVERSKRMFDQKVHFAPFDHTFSSSWGCGTDYWGSLCTSIISHVSFVVYTFHRTTIKHQILRLDFPRDLSQENAPQSSLEADYITTGNSHAFDFFSQRTWVSRRETRASGGASIVWQNIVDSSRLREMPSETECSTVHTRLAGEWPEPHDWSECDKLYA